MAVALALAACTSSSGSSSSGSSSSNSSSSSGSDAASSGSSGSSSGSDGAPGDDATVITCQNDPRVDTYVANLTKTSASGALKVTLVAGDPAPPAVGTNTWTIRVTDGAGAPMTHAPISVATWMPDHGHTSSVKAVVTAQDDGKYSVTPLYLFMPGVWRITFALPATDAGPGESAVFFFCIAG